MRLPFSLLLVWRPTNYLHPRLFPNPISLSIQTSFFAVPPQKPTVHDEKGRRLLSKLGPYKVGDEAVVTCKTTGGESNRGRTQLVLPNSVCQHLSTFCILRKLFAFRLSSKLFLCLLARTTCVPRGPTKYHGLHLERSGRAGSQGLSATLLSSRFNVPFPFVDYLAAGSVLFGASACEFCTG